MRCRSYRGALLDVALGAPEPPGLEAHLASCPECREALERERAHVSRMDLELRFALEVEPSPALLPRARRRAAEEPSPAWPWLRWLVPAAVGLAALAGAILPGPASTPPPAPPSAVLRPIPAPPREPPAPDVAAAKPAPERKATTAAPPRSARTRQARTRPPRPNEPEVLLSAGERAAFLRFVRDMQQRQVDRISLLAAGLDRGDIRDIGIAAVEVEPLAIEPITRSDR